MPDQKPTQSIEDNIKEAGINASSNSNRLTISCWNIAGLANISRQQTNHLKAYLSDPKTQPDIMGLNEVQI